MTMLLAETLHYQRRHSTILRGASLSLRQGELVSLLGENGAGKTTLLRLLMGFETPAQGLIRLDGVPLSSLTRRDIARRIAYVPQAHAAPFPYQVQDIVALGRLPHDGLFQTNQRDARNRAREVLGQLGIAHLAQRPYTAISGGERQLTLIARALAQEARLLILDEPLNGLDYGNQIRLLDHLQSLAARGYGIVMSTHHPDHAANASTRVAVLHGGVIEQDGPADQVMTPATIHRIYGVTVRRDQVRFIPVSTTPPSPQRR